MNPCSSKAEGKSLMRTLGHKLQKEAGQVSMIHQVRASSREKGCISFCFIAMTQPTVLLKAASKVTDK